MSDRDKDAEILALRHQTTVLERHLRGERVLVGCSAARCTRLVDPVSNRWHALAPVDNRWQVGCGIAPS